MLSIKYHPDKAEDIADAEEKFIEISKAYQSLTDEDIRKNWEEYGNPDGQKSTFIIVMWVDSASYSSLFRVFLGNRITILDSVIQ